MVAKYAVIFPGQGSQSKGMLHDMYANHQLVQDCFLEAAEVLGYDLWKIIQDDEESLNQTAVTQPALLAADVALYRCWEQMQTHPAAYFAGHSLGEYSALVCAGSVSFADGLRLVEKRGQFMQQAVAVGVGAMAAIIGLDEQTVEDICVEVAKGEVVSPANFNSPGQIVVSGEKAAVERAVVAAQSRDAKLAKVLAVSVPSHCALMAPAQHNLQQCFTEVAWSMPAIPVIHNVTVAIATDIQDMQHQLIEQLVAPVRWVETINDLHQNNVNVFLECGPGKVLTSLGKRISKTSNNLSLASIERMQQALDIIR